MSGPIVLKIVVENSVLDLATINNTIRSLSKEFREIGETAMVEHASYRQGLEKVNSQFKFHYCTLCEKPHIFDGSWAGDLCDCRLDEPSEHVTRETHRRMRLRAVGDPRLDPLFAGLSSKAKLLRVVPFTMSFSREVMSVIMSSSWLYRTSAFPLLPLNLVLAFKQYNEAGFAKLSICMYVGLLLKEFYSTGAHCTILLDIALQVLAAVRADPSEEEHYRQLLDNDAACLEMFLGSDSARHRFFAAVSKSFWETLTLHFEDNAIFGDILKNLGNTIGTFLTEPEYEASLFLESEHIQDMLRTLPETFVWMPIYGGRQEDYVPPVNRFASHATNQNVGASSEHQEE